VKNFINKIPKEKLQRYLFLGALILVFVAFFISLTLIGPEENKPPVDPNPPVDVDPPVEKPVSERFKIPTTVEYKFVRKFYDVNGTEEEQFLGLIDSDGIYSNSNGISVAAEDGKGFDVISTLTGVVSKVTESPIYGFKVTVKHSNEVFTEYSSLSKVDVKAGDKLKQGDVIGTSGESEFDPTAGNHVHFKVIKGDVKYNPEKLIGKELKDVK
jgi:stage II sporulation protein Q